LSFGGRIKIKDDGSVGVGNSAGFKGEIGVSGVCTSGYGSVPGNNSKQANTGTSKGNVELIGCDN